MDHRNSERAGGAELAEPKVEWTAPQVDKLVAGGAGAAAGADVEGLDGLS